MARDLYTADFDREPLTFEDVTEFLGLSRTKEDRPSEGTLFDCKAATSAGDLDTAPIAKAVVAFANTFGGLLFVGVTEDNGKPDQAVGIIRGRSELKTRIQNALRTTVLPVVPLKIGVVEVASSGSTPRDVAVIQIPEGERPPYVFMEGRTHKVIVRRNDESAQASLTELDALYEKRDRLRTGTELPSIPGNNGASLTRELAHDGAYARMFFQPEHRLALSLHRKHEVMMRDALQEHFGNEHIVKDNRGGEDYEVEIDTGQVRRRWYMDEHGVIGFATSIVRTAPENTIHHGGKAVFLVSLVHDLVRAVQTGRAILQSLGWHGRVNVKITLRLADFEIVNSTTRSNMGFTVNLATLQLNHIEGDETEEKLGNSELADGIGFVARAVQRLLRRIRHADIDLERFEESIRDLLSEPPA